MGPGFRRDDGRGGWSIRAMLKFNIRDMAAGAVFALIGLSFLVGALMLDIGTAFKMGPGYFPLLLSGILLLLGVLVMVQSLRSAPEAIGAVPWRGLVLILAAPIIFGATVRGLGLVIALTLAIIAAAAASRRTTLTTGLALVVGLTIFCVLVFSYGLGLPLPLFGRWLNL